MDASNRVALPSTRTLRAPRVGKVDAEFYAFNIETTRVGRHAPASGGPLSGPRPACRLPPARGHLTIEHVMPQKLTDDWRVALGVEAEEKHGRYRDRLSNLTLSGDAINSGMGAGSFDAKRAVYRDSSIRMTRRLADEDEWNEEALERRAEDLARRALSRWPWHDQSASARETQDRSAGLRWRIEGGPWHTESAASQMVLNVAGALLSRNQANAERLSGEAISSNVHPASRYPPGTTAGTLTLRAVPGHDDYVLYPYEQDYPTSAKRCRKMGERCGVTVEVEFEEDSRTKVFWRLLADRAGGVPGQKDTWRGPSQWTSPLNSSGDRIVIHVGNPELLWLYIRAGESAGSPDRAARMRQYSWRIRDQMGDQDLGTNLEKNSEEGWTVTVRRWWTRDDEDERPEATEWIKEQYERLQAILADSPGEGEVATMVPDHQATPSGLSATGDTAA